MKKFLSIIVSLALLVSLCASGGIMIYADESRTDVEAVFDSETGETPNTSADAWGFCVVGGSVWANDSFCGVDVEKLREYFRDGYSLAVTYSGTPGEGAVAVLNGDFDNGVKMTTAELGDGKYESTVSLKAVLDSYGKTADEVEGLAVQSWTTDFKLYHVEYYRLSSGESEGGSTDVAFEWTASEKNTVDAGWLGTGFLNERRQDFLDALSADGAYLEIEGNSTCTEYDATVQLFVNEDFEGGAYQFSGNHRGEFKCGAPVSELLADRGKELPFTELTFQFMIWEHEKNHLEDGEEVADKNFYLNALRVYVPGEGGKEDEPAAAEVKLNIYLYPASHSDTSTWDNTYYEGFTGDEYYDVFGKETSVVTDVSTKWDIATSEWSYIWLGIEDKEHDPRHSFTVEISDIVFRTADSDYTYSGAKGEYSVEAWGNVMIPVKVSDVCGEQDIAEFLKSLETVSLTVKCTEHDGVSAESSAGGEENPPASGGETENNPPVSGGETGSNPPPATGNEGSDAPASGGETEAPITTEGDDPTEGSSSEEDGFTETPSPDTGIFIAVPAVIAALAAAAAAVSKKR